VTGSSDAGGIHLIRAAHLRGMRCALWYQGLLSDFFQFREPKGTRDRLGFFLDRTLLPRMERRQARAADLAVCSSERTRKQVIQEHGVDPAKVVTVMNGYVPWPPRSETEKEEARRALGLDPKGFYAAFVGGDQERKGIATARAAVKAARAQGVPVRLLNVGRDQGESPEEVRYGYLTDEPKRRVLAASDVFIYPTQYESSPMPVREAAALGLPVISTPQACIEEGVAGKDYLISDPHDVPGFTAALLRLYREPGWASDLAQRGRTVLSVWTYEQQARGWQQALERLLGITSPSDRPPAPAAA
jgi:glycosyltransferase involved in cell wall biosynthesis